jgi:outer membrane lipoprotein-sorting protein
MHKIIGVLMLLSVGKNLFAQYPGYTLIKDQDAFRKEFSVASGRLTSLKSDFLQEKSLSMLSEKIESKGKFWFKKDNLVRMEYTQPFQYLMILNNNNVLINDGQKENKMSTRSNKLFQQINRIIVDCVKGSALSNTDFSMRAFVNGQGYLIELNPQAKNLKEFFKTINITVDKKDYSVLKIEMNELSGDNTSIVFINKEQNLPISDALFAIH